jgi:hypothetical protein
MKKKKILLSEQQYQKMFIEESEDVYLYHGTSKGATLGIQRDGYMKTNNTGEKMPSISFTNSLDYAKYYANSKGGVHNSVILRIKKNNNFTLSPRIRNNKGVEYISFEPVLSKDLQVLTLNGDWENLDGWNIIFNEPISN